MYVRSGQGGGENVAIGTFTGSSSSNTKVTLGFKPKKLCYYGDWTSAKKLMVEYDEDISTTTVLAGYRTSSNGFNQYTIGATNSNIPNSIDNDGFTIRPVLSDFNGLTISYFAIG